MVKNETFYLNLIESLDCGYAYHEMIYDEKGKAVDYKYLDVNQHFLDLTGLKRKAVLGKTVTEIFPGIDDLHFKWIKTFGNVVKKGKTKVIEEYFSPLSRWYSITVFSHEPNHFVTIFSDITSKKLLDEETSHFFDMSLDMLSLIGFDGYFKKLSNSWQDVLGWSLEELMSKPMIEFIHSDDVYNTVIMIQNLTEGRNIVDFENRYLCKDGTYRWIQWRSNSVVDREVIYAVARDVTQHKELEFKLKEANKELKRKAISDSLTNVFNHQFITEALKKKIEVAKRYKQELSILMLDLDNFKGVNDTYGHLVGDEVLIEVVEKIKACMRKADFLGRYGGEEFLLVLPRTDLEGASTLAERIRRNIEKSTFKEEDLKVTVSIGVTSYKSHDCSDLINDADACMYRAKRLGKNRVEICKK